MYQLDQTLGLFIEAVRQNLPIDLRSKGLWKYENGLKRIWNALTDGDERRRLRVAKAFNHYLDHLETTPILFHGEDARPVQQPVDYQGYMMAADVVESSILPLALSRAAKLELLHLRRSRLAIKYRLEFANGGLSPNKVVDRSLLERLIELAAAWKMEQKIFWNHYLTQLNRQRIEEAVLYDDFGKLLLRDPLLQDHFFEWVIRDGIDPAPYIEFPAMQRKVTANKLNGRIGRLGGLGLKIQREQPNRKILTLPFEGKDINILDEKLEIMMSGHYRLTIKEVFHIFSKKETNVGNLEYFAMGITNWNTHWLGWWNADEQVYEVVDLTQADWWTQLPLFEVLSLEEARQRYGDHLDGKKWNLAAKAAREYLTLDFTKTHAYLEMAIPMGRNCYGIYDFGKFSTRVPDGTLETLAVFAITNLATIDYPDTNVYYTHRQHIGYSFELTPEEGMTIMNYIREDMYRARDKRVVYQIETENCARWIQTRLEKHLGKERVPNLFMQPLIESEPTGTMGKIFFFIRSMPRFLHKFLLLLIHYPFAPWRGTWVLDDSGNKIWKSLTASTFWKDGIVYHPSYLHKLHESGALADELACQRTYLIEKKKQIHKKPVDYGDHDN